MSLTKRVLVLASLAAIAFFGSTQTTVATAEVVVEELALVAPVKSQSYVVPTVVEAPVIRDTFGVTVYDIVGWPIISTATSDCFGCRGGSHMGTDFVPGGGSPVSSVAKGTVIQAGYNGCYGNSITIQHYLNGQDVVSVYGHMLDGSLRVGVGDWVDQGQQIGSVGTTGCSTGNHLHLEIHISGVPVDPEAWLYANVNEYDWN